MLKLLINSCFCLTFRLLISKQNDSGRSVSRRSVNLFSQNPSRAVVGVCASSSAPPPPPSLAEMGARSSAPAPRSCEAPEEERQRREERAKKDLEYFQAALRKMDETKEQAQARDGNDGTRSTKPVGAKVDMVARVSLLAWVTLVLVATVCTRVVASDSAVETDSGAATAAEERASTVPWYELMACCVDTKMQVRKGTGTRMECGQQRRAGKRLCSCVLASSYLLPISAPPPR